MEARRAIALPAKIPAPKFGFFERVRFEDQVLTITGLEYLDAATAQRRNLEYGYYGEEPEWTPGWEYTMSLAHGAPLEAVEGMMLEPLQLVATEDELEPLEG
ncbi:hypothetical protein C7B82_10205 [Stenomitos frigidus ULC18]|uniref:Uncharacterized protein n=1 Tax=Stenomitos frigidus ULC18 TaxID=2107698 RepID=A0A2T1EAX6_9CYAN|nr:hypothetical protein C7B82_10205 [Stenomitos frigidus ULC18]